MKKVVYVWERYSHSTHKLYNVYTASTKIGALLKALWYTRFKWGYFIYQFE